MTFLKISVIIYIESKERDRVAIDMERIEQLRHLCRVDLMQQEGYRIETQEFLVPPSESSLYTLTAKKNRIQFDLGRPLFLSELDKGVKELYDIMTQQGILKKHNDWYGKLVEELWGELSKVGCPLLTQTGAGLPLKWRLEFAGVEYLGATILEVLNKAMAHLNPSLMRSPTDELLHIVEENGKMVLHLNGAPIPNLESCWITPRENGALEVEITYTIEPKG